MTATAKKPQAATRVLSYAGALLETMDAGLGQHPNAFIMGQGVDDFKGIFGSTTNLHKKYGAARVFDTPLMEEGMTGIAIGASLVGDYPITTHIRADFSFLAMNQIINLASKYRYMFGGIMSCPMLIRVVVGRSWGQGAQHSQSPQATFAHYPGLTVVMPATSQAILDMYPQIIGRHPGPVISIEHRLLYNLDFTVSDHGKPIPLTSYVAREGKDVTVVATSVMVVEALRAAQYIHDKTGIEAEIIDLNSISHPDWDLVANSVKKTGKLVIADTSWSEYGVAGEVCRQLVMRDPGLLRSPPSMLGMAYAPCPTAKSLEDLYYPSQHETVDAILTQARGGRHGVELPSERSMTEAFKKFRGPF
ncbi:MAG TPA: transketolase C-terminal domain-containing protein [Reyranella sp.]|nr:transketolase C-terminal domain-containing protein [Reyranella sp.]